MVLIDSDRPPQGCGEVSLDPVALAVASAIFKASGLCHRAMPMPMADDPVPPVRNS